LALCLVAAAAFAQDKPYPVFTSNHLDATMKTLGPNVAGVRVSLVEGDFTTAKARIIRSREQLATTVTFWRDNEQDEALALLRTVLERMDALDAALSTDSVDGAAATTMVTEIGTACGACHAVYREEDSATGEYRPKQSALP
jgi:cytochrome c556